MQDNINSIVATKDGSNTLFSKLYNQHYHNPDDGAIDESLTKHIIPAFTFHKDKKELTILDICFGIGYNTFSTIYYVLQNNLDIKLNIYSPELDGNLVKSLDTFNFPKEFENIKHIIKSIAQTGQYKNEKINIEVFIGDARKYIKSLEKNSFDIVYQDAFSSDVNFELWTKEYFDDIYKLCKEDCIMSSYAIATPIRLSMNEASFYIYENRPIKRKITLAFKQKQEIIGTFVDMDLKRQRNKEAVALYDKVV
ncbi:MAG: MnmC family methyltransferase [Aliarcobacter sp.]|nr:MnmC family methyltransferase [Aliarcobacter sp.]